MGHSRQLATEENSFKLSLPPVTSQSYLAEKSVKRIMPKTIQIFSASVQHELGRKNFNDACKRKLPLEKRIHIPLAPNSPRDKNKIAGNILNKREKK